MVIGATAYNGLRNVLYDLTGQWWGIEVEELDEEENKEMTMMKRTNRTTKTTSSSEDTPAVCAEWVCG